MTSTKKALPAGNANNQTRSKVTDANYIFIQKYFWHIIQYRQGFNNNHIALFFAVFDCLNDNFFNKTKLPFVHILNKCKLGNKTYYSARDWLVDNKVFEIVEGKNRYEMASFSFTLEALNYTGSDIGKSPANDIGSNHANDYTTTHINKHINSKQLNNKTFKNAFSSKMHTHEQKDLFKKFQEWVNTEIPIVNKIKEPLTIDEFLKLHKKIPDLQFKSILTAMANKPNLLNRYSSAYKTILEWYERQQHEFSNGSNYKSMMSKLKRI